MEKALDKHGVERALALLGELLERRSDRCFNFVVCGGAALLVSELRRETTKDIDILALLTANGTMEVCAELPEVVRTAARDVAEEMGMARSWLNTGPSSMVNPNMPDYGLPDGFIERLIEKRYGSKLRIHYIARKDQIFFKLYAAVDRCAPSYHLADLKTLEPSEDELLSAAIWAMRQDPSSGFEKTLMDMLEKVGYGSIAEKLG
jgi:hypothetical protein